MFDTLTYANKLKEAGFTERQAETIATSQGQIINEQLVTREHFDFRIKELETKLDSRIKELELKQETRFKEQEVRFKDLDGQIAILRWMLGFILAGILSLIIKTFFAH